MTKKAYVYVWDNGTINAYTTLERKAVHRHLEGKRCFNLKGQPYQSIIPTKRMFLDDGHHKPRSTGTWYSWHFERVLARLQEPSCDVTVLPLELFY